MSLSTKGTSTTRSRSSTFVASAAVVALFALALAGCSSASQASGSTPKSNGAEQGTVDVATSGLGQILVDSQGRTPYLFAKDTGTQSECTGACASSWPPLHATGTPTVGGGAAPRWWQARCAPTVVHRSLTPATRSTSSRVIRTPATRTGRVSWLSAPAGTRYRPQALRSRDRHRARASGTRTVTRFRGAGPAGSRSCSATCASGAKSAEFIASSPAARRCDAKLVMLAIGIVTSAFAGGR